MYYYYSVEGAFLENVDPSWRVDPGWVPPVGPHAAAASEEGGGGVDPPGGGGPFSSSFSLLRKSPFRSRGRSSSPPLPLSSSAALVRDSSFLKKP